MGPLTTNGGFDKACCQYKEQQADHDQKIADMGCYSLPVWQ